MSETTVHASTTEAEGEQKKKVNERLYLGALPDDFVIGVMCAKTKLIEYALKNSKMSEERRRLFDAGVAWAVNCTTDDVAREMWYLRNRSSELFDKLLKDRLTYSEYGDVMRAIRHYKPHSRKKDRVAIEGLMAELSEMRRKA